MNFEGTGIVEGVLMEMTTVLHLLNLSEKIWPLFVIALQLYSVACQLTGFYF